MSYSYDDECEELARHFLADDKERVTDADVRDLAQAIQNCIEDWLFDWGFGSGEKRHEGSG